MKIVGYKYHFSQDKGIYNRESIEVIFYSILCGDDCLMKGQYTKQQKEINGDSEEARELMINRLLRQHAKSPMRMP